MANRNPKQRGKRRLLQALRADTRCSECDRTYRDLSCGVGHSFVQSELGLDRELPRLAPSNRQVHLPSEIRLEEATVYRVAGGKRRYFSRDSAFRELAELTVSSLYNSDTHAWVAPDEVIAAVVTLYKRQGNKTTEAEIRAIVDTERHLGKNRTGSELEAV